MIRYFFSNLKPLKRDKDILKVLRAIMPDLIRDFKGKGVGQNFYVWIGTEPSWLRTQKKRSLAHFATDDRLFDREGNHISMRGMIGVVSLRRKYLVSIVKLDPERIYSLIKHELVHYINHEHGHGKKYQAMAKSVGLKKEDARANILLNPSDVKKLLKTERGD